MTASFEYVDYSLRPNKNVERKLIAEGLLSLRRWFDFENYRYVGLGGIWFVDFVLLHRTLSIRDMISIQKGSDYAARASFNRPLGCIHVVPGETTTVLSQLKLREKPILMWLDYDSMLNGPVLDDINIVSGSLKSGDIALFTINADARRQLHNQKAKGGIVLERKAVLAERLDIPEVRIPDEAIEDDGFPPFAAAELFERLKSATREASGDELKFLPIFNYMYADGSPMITVGGIFADRALRQRLIGDGLLAEEGHIVPTPPNLTGAEQFSIRVPLLTHREKMALDRLLPHSSKVDAEVLARLGCLLKEEEVESYRQLYRHYPTFTEMAL